MQRQPLILIADDEREIRELIRIYLTNEGYAVCEAGDGQEAITLLKQQQIDLVLLDVMMPKMDGIKACLQIRSEHQMPIIMLSAKGQDMDKIWGLNVGADDYLTKPFNPMELIARVRSQLRRYLQFAAPQPTPEDTIAVGELVITPATHEVWVGGREAKLTRREFAILELLARHRGMVFSSQRIYEAVWSEAFCASDNTVMVHVRRVREKIEPDPRRPRYIKTVWGVGYKIEA